MQSRLLKMVILMQFVVLALVGYQTVLTKNQLETKSLESGTNSNGAEGEISPAWADRPVLLHPDLGQLDEKLLRQVIRSELAAFSELHAVPAPEATQEKPEIDPYENQLKLEVVRDRLSYYIEVGAISDAEMQNLQVEISRLDPESRSLMLRRLTQAIATGKIEGRL